MSLAARFKVPGGRVDVLAPNQAFRKPSRSTCNRYLPGGTVVKPNAPFDSLKVTASSGVSSSVDSVIAARRMGAPVASFRTTPLMAAKGEGGRRVVIVVMCSGAAGHAI